MGFLKAKYIPNIITFIRLILIFPVILFLLQKDYGIAFCLFLIAGLSDGVDGFLARKFFWKSSLGAFLDPLADKLLMMLTYLALGYLGDLPLWLVWIVIGRDLIILAGAICYRWWIEVPDYHATFISKLNTLLQLALVIFVLFNQVYFVFPRESLEILMYVVASTTISSLLDYIWIWGRRAYYVKRGLL